MTGDSRDLALLEGARAFEAEALAEIYDRYSPALYRYALRVLDEPSLAEDCVAETFSRDLDALRRGGGPQRYLKAYLYRTAHNWIVDNFRRSATATAHHDPVEVSDGQPAEVLAARLERQRVREALLRLAPEQRQEIVLKFLEAFTNEEVAAALGKSAGAVKSIQHRALDKLKDMLSERARRK